MPSFTEVRDLIVSNATNPRTRQKAIIVKGKPGSAKTSLGRAVAQQLGIDSVKVTHPARRNPINYMGVPDVSGDAMVWKEPEELIELSTGQHVMVIDEIGQCTPIMQNTVGSMMLDRCINRAKFSDDVIIIATTNNAEDRAGSKQLLTHLGNRAMIVQMEYTKDDFIPYGQDQGLDPLGLAFLEFRPGAMFNFDSAREINDTARSWEYALSLDPTAGASYIHALHGILTEGTVAEYLGFRQVAERMPDPKRIMTTPQQVEVPDEVQVMYALMSCLILETADVDRFETIMQFVQRCTPEFQTLYVTQCVRRVDSVNDSRVYVEWITRNHGNFGSS